MSRSRKPHGKSAAAGSVSTHSGGSTATSDLAVSAGSISPPARRPAALRVAIAAFLTWSLALVAMTLLTANPALVSRDQVRQADAVVLARPIEPGGRKVRIERILKGDLAVENVVSVVNLDDVAEVSPAQAYLMPLSFYRQDYVVTTLKGQHAPPLVYAATPETIGKAVEFLRETDR